MAKIYIVKSCVNEADEWSIRDLAPVYYSLDRDTARGVFENEKQYVKDLVSESTIVPSKILIDIENCFEAFCNGFSYEIEFEEHELDKYLNDYD